MLSACGSIANVDARFLLGSFELRGIFFQEVVDQCLRMLSALGSLPRRIKQPQVLEDVISENEFLVVLSQLILEGLDDVNAKANDLSVVAQLKVINIFEYLENLVEVLVLDVVEPVEFFFSFGNSRKPRWTP